MTQPNDETEFFFEGESLSFTFDDDLEGSSSEERIIIQNEDYVIVKRAKSSGCKCSKCGDFYQYAEPNQEDGTFKCWGCRH